jgi:uncharacterized protein (DUF58 family)
VRGWRPTGALVRSTATAVVLALGAVALGRPDLLVLAVPFGLLTALALAHAPRRPLQSSATLADRWLHEGQGTRLRIDVADTVGVEQVTTTLVTPSTVVSQPPSGMLATSPRGPGPVTVEHAVSPRRWGRHSAGTALVGATTLWGGYRWGPERLPERTLVALPDATAATSGENPHPVGLIGQNTSRRRGDGTELDTIRPFQPGDRMRRINWRTTLRTGTMHAVGSTAQQDSSVLLLLDAVLDVGRSGGVDGAASSLDLGVRAAGALATHHLRVGDRVALRVLGRATLTLGPGTGTRHQRRLQELLAQVEPGWPSMLGTSPTRVRVVPGTVVVALSPMLTPEITTLLVVLARRGLPVVVVDTLGPDAVPEPAREPGTAAQVAWRMRLVERRMQLTEVSREGIAVVAWRGPGTLDEVLRRLARRARLPREVSR